MRQRRCFVPAVLAALVLVNSCIGASADISFKKDGSGSVDLEYRISRMAESLGKLDGNEGWPLVPLGRNDFERTLRRIEGLRLRSFSSREKGEDLIVRVKLEFDRPAALVRFLDPLGEWAVFSEGDGKRLLSLTLREGGEETDPELLKLFGSPSPAYELKLGFSLPGEGELVLRDRQGNPCAPPGGAEILNRGKRLRFRAPMEEVLSGPGGLAVDIRW